MKIVSIVGARPQFVKAAAVSRVLRKAHTEIILHTGQHYDRSMSSVFFEELDIPLPDYNLEVGSGPHGRQTGTMLAGIEDVLLKESPDCVLIYGDTNSTLAGALAAAKLHIRVGHVEAGLRSFNREMPEEINRVIADHLSSLLLCPSRTGVDNLAREGIIKGVHLVGDVMLDALLLASERARSLSRVLEHNGLTEKGFILVTLHRAENTDDPRRLKQIMEALSELDTVVLFPVHPRTRHSIEQFGLGKLLLGLRTIEPVSYLEMVNLEQSARLILTDSGGVQKEAYWLGAPCITLREETEWPETVEMGWNILVGANKEKIIHAARTFLPPAKRPFLYGDGKAAARCVAALDTLPQREAQGSLEPAILTFPSLF